MKKTEHGRSRHFNIMLIALATAGLIAAFVAIDPMAWASRKHGHGWGRHQENNHMALQFCDGDHGDRVNDMGAYIDSWLALDEAQRAAWGQVEAEIEQGVVALQEACGNFAGDELPPTMPERLALMETLMAAGTDMLRGARPAFDAFYAALDEDQRRRLDQAAGRWHDPAPR